MSEPTEVKLCPGCGEFLPRGGENSAFHRDRTHADGYKSICKDCRSKTLAERNQAVPMGPRKSKEELESDARVMAIRWIVEDHKRDFDRYLGRARKQLGLEITWQQVK